jgi:hypothetical protein
MIILFYKYILVIPHLHMMIFLFRYYLRDTGRKGSLFYTELRFFKKVNHLDVDDSML